MITHIRIRNFKTLEDAEFNLGAAPVVLVGPNNCGKTSILQALTMWRVGVREWLDKNTGQKGKTGRKLRGVGIPQANFLALPVPYAQLIWHGQEVRKKGPVNIAIEIEVKGETKGEPWNIGVEFEYDRPHLITCRPTSRDFSHWQECCPDVAFLQPMSGLADEEDQLRIGSINDRLGKGKTADVLRNICYQLAAPEMPTESEQNRKNWGKVVEIMERKFFVKLLDPQYGPARGKIHLAYEQDGKEYDLSSAGRGFHQTLLLLSYMYTHPGSAVLLDEPDAHLEIIRQRDTFSLLREVAREQKSQLIIASHSEIVLAEGVDSGSIVSVIEGKTENLTDNQHVSQFRKLLTSIGWDTYYLAKAGGHVLFVEGSTDKDMLVAFAEKSGFPQPAIEKLKRAHFLYVGNVVSEAKKIFYGLREVISDLRGLALFDRPQEDKTVDGNALEIITWRRNEIENYLLMPEVLRRFARQGGSVRESELGPLISATHLVTMEEAIQNNTTPKAMNDKEDAFWLDAKMSDYLGRIFDDFYAKSKLQSRMPKSRYHLLIGHMTKEEVPDEMIEVLKKILAVIREDENAPQS